MDTNLSNAQRLGFLCGSLAAFALAPTNARKSDVTKAIKEYQDAWVSNNKTESLFHEDWDAEALSVLRNEADVAEFLQAIRFAVIEYDVESMDYLRLAAKVAQEATE